MGQDDNLHASLAHIVLCCMAGHGLSKISGKSFTHPGMHANFFVHGVLGFLRYQSSAINSDVSAAYGLSLKLTKYLALPCLMADMYRRGTNSNENMSMLHLVSGLVPTLLAITGQDNPQLAHLVVAVNVISLGVWSVQNDRQWGYYTTGAALLAYFFSPQGGPVLYPLALSLMEYCAIRLYHYEPEPLRR